MACCSPVIGHNPPQPTVVADVHELLRTLGPVADMRLIAIDGVGGAGKSALAAQLAAALNAAEHLDLDDFLIKKQDKFFDALRLDDLKAALKERDGLVVMSGICMLRLLAALGRYPDILIYVKRMAKWGWADEDEIDGDELERTAEALGASIDEWPLQIEVRDYHRSYCPHKKAAIVLERMEDC